MEDVPGALIKMDISKERAIKVDYQGKNYKIKGCQERLYYYGTTADNYISVATDISNATIYPYLFLIPLKHNKHYFRSNYERIIQGKYNISLDGLALPTSSLLLKKNSFKIIT